jgi:signal peptidase I
MEPTLRNGDVILASGIRYLITQPKVNEIVVFKSPSGQIMLKQITKVDNDKYFLEGNNKEDSLDSRQFGWVTKKQILGKMIYKI